MEKFKSVKLKKFLTVVLSLAVMITMMPATVFAGDGGGGAGGSRPGSSGAIVNVDHRGRTFVWFDRGGWTKDELNGGREINPVQGYFDSDTGKWYNASGGNAKKTSQNFFTYNFFIGKLEEKVHKATGKNWGYNKMRPSWTSGEADESFRKQMETACRNAIKRANKGKPDLEKVHRARVVGVAVTYATIEKFESKSSGITYKKLWALWPNKKNKTYKALFGGDSKDRYPKTADEKGELMKKYGWTKNVRVLKGNEADADESWAHYVYRMGKEDNKKYTAREGKSYVQTYVVAVADGEPGSQEEFETKLETSQGAEGGDYKLNESEPGNVSARDEILYKNLEKATYTVSADLVVANIDMTEADDADDVEEGSGEDEDLDEAGSSAVSEDGYVSILGDEVTIAAGAEEKYHDGKWWVVLIPADENGEYWNANGTCQELNLEAEEVGEGETASDQVAKLEGLQDKMKICIYYGASQPDWSTESPICLDVYSEGSDDEDEEEPIDDSGSDVTEGTVIASLNKVTPNAPFKAGSGQTAWQRGSFIEFKGIDLYKKGLYNSVSNFNKEYTLGVRADIYDGNTINDKLNEDLKEAAEATKVKNPFGTISFGKVAEYNWRPEYEQEVGAVFQVYSNEFDSYEAAVADAKDKGYETYKYDYCVYSGKNIDHGKIGGTEENLIDHLDWQLHNGMFVPGTYVVKQISTGNYYKPMSMADPWNMEVTVDHVNKEADRTVDKDGNIINPTDQDYTFNLKLQKISADKFETGDNNHNGDQAFQHSTLLNKETTFRVESLNDQEMLSAVGYDKTFKLTEEDGSSFTITGLKSGKYRITEVVTPTGYYMPTDPEDSAYVDVTIGMDMNAQGEPKITIDQIHQNQSGFTQIDADVQNVVDDDGGFVSGGEDPASKVKTVNITWTKSNIPQDTSLKLKKTRVWTNEAQLEEDKALPNVEFNLYAVGDIIAYDGHGNHKYYTDGQLIQGIVIDEDTGERHFYLDGEEVTEGSYVPAYEDTGKNVNAANAAAANDSPSTRYYKWQKVDNIQKYRILTDNAGEWNSLGYESASDATSKTKGTYIEYLGADSSSFPYYPLNNANLIKLDGGDTTDGESHYKFQEMYIWEAGGHISFTEQEKKNLRDIWVDKLGQDADAEITAIGMSFNQILNHGIDVTSGKTTDSQGNQDETVRFSSNGNYLDQDTMFKQFLQNRLIGTDGQNYLDLKERKKTDIIDETNAKLGTVDWGAWVIDPDSNLKYDIKNTSDTFEVLPVDRTIEHADHTSIVSNKEEYGLQTVASLNGGAKKYDPSDKKITIKDTVRYNNLQIDQTYELVGTLMNPATGQPFMHDGEPITAKREFTPENYSGEVEVTFKDVLTEDLGGASVVVFEKLYLEGEYITGHEKIDDPKQLIPVKPNMGTEASWKEDRVVKETIPAEDIMLYDEVEYHGLTPGKEYTITGYLYNAETMEPILKDGITMKENASETGMAAVNKDTGKVNLEKLDTLDDAVTGFATFTPETTDGVVTIEFGPFNAVGLEGTKIVTFEEEIPSRGTPDYLVHANINDEPQITFIPEIKTEAKADDIDMACAEKSITIVDKVTYKNLEPNTNHVMKGVLMDQETKAPVEIDGQQVTASQPFTSSETGSGEVEMEFTFTTTGLEGHNLVVFEKCYNAEGDAIAEHENINDVPQTVVIPKVRTTAVDSKTDTHLAELTQKQKIIDVVKYSNLIGGRDYVVKGVLMDKQTGKPLKDAKGKEFTAEKKFTVPATEGIEEGALDLVSGEVKLEFEVDATALEGTTAVAFEELYFQDKLVGEHKQIEDKKQTVSYPSVRTMALDNLTKEHVAALSDKEIVKDTVKMTGLIKGDTYTVKGTLMDKKTGKAVMKDGKPVTAERTFVAGGGEAKAEEPEQAQKPEAAAETGDQNAETPATDAETPKVDADTPATDAETPAADTNTPAADTETPAADAETPAADAEQPAAEEPKEEPKEEAKDEEIEFVDETIELEFEVDSTKLVGTTAVAFEELYYKDILVGDHKNIEDKDQTIYYPEILTKATAKAGGKTVKADSGVVIIDHVTYKNLVPGKEYTVSGVLMDKSTGKELTVNGKTVTASRKFTPSKANGTVDITFSLNASSLNGKKAVVFETMMLGNIVVAEHKDIKDKDQTVSFSKKVPKNGSKKTSIAHPLTGDSGFPFWALILLAIALAGAAGAMIYRRKRASTGSRE